MGENIELANFENTILGSPTRDIEIVLEKASSPDGKKNMVSCGTPKSVCSELMEDSEIPSRRSFDNLNIQELHQKYYSPGFDLFIFAIGGYGISTCWYMKTQI